MQFFVQGYETGMNSYNNIMYMVTMFGRIMATCGVWLLENCPN